MEHPMRYAAAFISLAVCLLGGIRTGANTPFGVVMLSPAFDVNGAGSNIDSIAFWEGPGPDLRMYVTSKGPPLVEVWLYPYTSNEQTPLTHPSFGDQSSVQVNGVVVDQATDLLYVAVSDPTSTVSVFSLPNLTFQFEFIHGAEDLQNEPNVALLNLTAGGKRVYVSADSITYVHDATTGAAIRSFAPVAGLETMWGDDHYQTLYIPDEKGGTGVYAFDPDGTPVPGPPVGGGSGNPFGGGGTFESDAEGIALYNCLTATGDDMGAGWIVVADQKATATDFEFFDRRSWAHLGTVQLTEVNNTDGIASTQMATPAYPQGILAAIDDDTSTVGIGWHTIMNATGLSCPPQSTRSRSPGSDTRPE
jgi:3-phytase